MSNQLATIAQTIPLNPKAKATPACRTYIQGVLQNIEKRRNTIQAEANRQKQEALLDSYRKSVGFAELNKKCEKALEHQSAENLRSEKIREEAGSKAFAIEDAAQRKTKEVRDEISKLGLTFSGTLMSPRKQLVYSVMGEQTGEAWYADGQLITTKQADRLKEIADLIAAVGASRQTVTENETLNMRLMMATTVGELIAIVNAVAGEDVFGMGEIPGHLEIADK